MKKTQNIAVVIVQQPSKTDKMFGKHRHIWADEDPIAYIRKERASWRD